MGNVLAEILPLAIGVALSPLPIVAVSHKDVGRDARIVLYCAAGARSAAAARQLQAAGFASVSDLSGGLATWPGRLVKP